MKKPRWMWRWLGLVTLNSLFFLYAAQAAVFEVTPVQLYLSAKQPIGVLKITNQSDENSLLHLSLVSWMQKSGENLYQPSQDILLTPPMFKIPAHHSQIVRFALKRPVFGYMQKTYRVQIKEIDQGHPSRETGQKLYFLMNFSVPLFVEPQHRIDQAAWTVKCLDKNKVKLSVRNEGNITLFINKWRLINQQRNIELAKKSTFVYVLPHQSYAWITTINKNEKINQIIARVNGENKRVNIDVAK